MESLKARGTSLRTWAGILILALAPGIAAAQSTEQEKKTKTPPPQEKSKQAPPPKQAARPKQAPPRNSEQTQKSRPPAKTPPPQTQQQNQQQSQRQTQQQNQQRARQQTQQQNRQQTAGNTSGNAKARANAGANTRTGNPNARQNRESSNAAGRTGGRDRGSSNASNSGAGQPRPSARPFTPPAGASHQARQDGGHEYSRGDQRWQTNSQGQLTHYSAPGREARFAPSGRVRYVHDDRHGITVRESVRGGRVVETVRPGGVRVVSYGPRRGFVQAPIALRPGFVQRTYVVNNVRYTRVYHTYAYRNVTIVRYVPAVYYAPAFYGWAYRPWGPRVVFAWGWGGAPWYGFYGYYFAPAPYYPSAAFWLTDYLIAENLRLAYENRQLANEAAEARAEADEARQENESSALTPEVKQQIADEVQRQLQEQQSSSGGVQPTSDLEGLPPALDPNQRTFIVSSSMDVDLAGQSCSLTAGDILTRLDDQPDSDGAVQVMVSSSKRGDCRIGAKPRIQVSDLQEMHNDFRAQMDQGLETLSANQGKGGLPSGPAANPRPVAAGQAAPDASADSQLQKQQQDANDAVEEVKKVPVSGPGN